MGAADLSAEEQELKAACRALVKSFGGQDAVAETLGVRQQKVSDWVNPRMPEYMPLSVVALLESCTVGHGGHPAVTRLTARRAGYILVPAPRTVLGEEAILRALAAISAELGDVSRELMEAQADDGRIDPGEARRTLAELDAMEARSGDLRSALMALADPDSVHAGGRR